MRSFLCIWERAGLGHLQTHTCGQLQEQPGFVPCRAPGPFQYEVHHHHHHKGGFQASLKLRAHWEEREITGHHLEPAYPLTYTFQKGFSISRSSPWKPRCALEFGLPLTERPMSENWEFHSPYTKPCSPEPTCTKQSHYKTSSVTMQQPVQSVFHRLRRGGESPGETRQLHHHPHQNFSTSWESLFTAPTCLTKAKITHISRKFTSFGCANAIWCLWPAFIKQGCLHHSWLTLTLGGITNTLSLSKTPHGDPFPTKWTLSRCLESTRSLRLHHTHLSVLHRSRLTGQKTSVIKSSHPGRGRA